MKSFLKTIAACTLVVGIYHVAMGLMVYDITKHLKGEDLTTKETSIMILQWPQILVANHYMADQYKELMTGIEEILNEINSGRWERKPQ